MLFYYLIWNRRNFNNSMSISEIMYRFSNRVRYLLTKTLYWKLELEVNCYQKIFYLFGCKKYQINIRIRAWILGLQIKCKEIHLNVKFFKAAKGNTWIEISFRFFKTGIKIRDFIIKTIWFQNVIKEKVYDMCLSINPIFI